MKDDKKPKPVIKKCVLNFRLPSKRETTELTVLEREAREWWMNFEERMIFEERMRRKLNGW